MPALKTLTIILEAAKKTDILGENGAAKSAAHQNSTRQNSLNLFHAGTLLWKVVPSRERVGVVCARNLATTRNASMQRR